MKLMKVLLICVAICPSLAKADYSRSGETNIEHGGASETPREERPIAPEGTDIYSNPKFELKGLFEPQNTFVNAKAAVEDISSSIAAPSRPRPVFGGLFENALVYAPNAGAKDWEAVDKCRDLKFANSKYDYECKGALDGPLTLEISCKDGEVSTKATAEKKDYSNDRGMKCEYKPIQEENGKPVNLDRYRCKEGGTAYYWDYDASTGKLMDFELGIYGGPIGGGYRRVCKGKPS